MRSDELSRTANQTNIFRPIELLFNIFPGFIYELILSFFYFSKIHLHLSCQIQTQLITMATNPGPARTGNISFCWCAAGIDASTSYISCFDHSHRLALQSEPESKRYALLTCPDDDMFKSCQKSIGANCIHLLSQGS